MEFFDSHAHYDDEKFDQDREEILNQIYQEGIKHVLTAGYSLEGSKQAIHLAEKYKYIYASCGISPNDLEEYQEKDIQTIKEWAKHPKVVAIGEIGLDYYWSKENKELQKEIFIKQIEVANQVGLPIIIHTREAVADTIDILKNQVNAIKHGVFHCCPLNPELIKEALKLGFYISFAGPITFKNAKHAEEAIQLVPNEKILIETDSPYLAPEPYRGTRNDSIKMKETAKKVAQVKGISLEEVAILTSQNAKKLFQIQD